MAKSSLPNNEAAINISLIIDQLPSMIYRRKNDAAWSMEYISKGSKKITGYLPEEFLTAGKIGYKDLILASDINNVLQEINSSLEKRTPFTINYRINDNNNNIKWIFERGEGIFSSENELLAVEGFITDISEEKKVQKKFDEMLSLLNSAINAITEGILVVDIHNKITYSNLKFQKMWRIPDVF